MKKVYAKKYFKLSQDAALALESRRKTSGKTQVQIVEDLLTGRDRFAPDVEQWIAREMARTGLPRDVLIERSLLAMIQRKAPPARARRARRG